MTGCRIERYRLTIWSCTDRCAWPSASPVCGRWPSPSPWSRCRLRHTARHLPVGHTEEETRWSLGETLSGWGGKLSAKCTGSKPLCVSSTDSLGGDLMAAVFTQAFFSCIRTILPLKNKTETKLQARINLLESYLRKYVTFLFKYLTQQFCRNYIWIIHRISVISADG